jgi:hypothetical protein
MQRNMDLVRTILLRIEADPTGRAPHDLGIVSYSPEEVGYHAHIMAQDGLIDGIDITTLHSKGTEFLPTKLTWKGHEFLDLARDQMRWNQAKAIIAKVGSAPITMWTKVLSELLWKNVAAAK